MTHDLVVRNARLVDAGVVRQVDLAVDGGRVAVVGDVSEPGTSEIDAAGRVVTPGGVDSHVHLGQRSSRGDWTADDFWTGSRSAAHGGTTTVIPFAAQHRGMRVRDVYEEALARAGAQMAIDYGFHVIVTDPEVPGFDDDLAWLAEQGIVGIKIYLTYDKLRVGGSVALDLMAQAAAQGLSVMVHAEDDALIGWGRQQALARGETGADGHVRSHSRAAERAGVATAIAWAEESGATLVLAHLSVPDSVDQVAAARARGVEVYAETCPHYLLLDETLLAGPIEKTAAFMSSPPVRSRSEAEAMTELVRTGDVHLVTSDHSPYTEDQKLPAGAETAFTEVANGVPGVETRLAVVRAALGEEHLATWVEVACAAPARLARMFPRKGSLQVGSDADLVVWGSTPWQISAADLHDAVGTTPFEGTTVPSRPELVLAGGEVLVGRTAAGLEPGRGRRLTAGAGTG